MRRTSTILTMLALLVLSAAPAFAHGTKKKEHAAQTAAPRKKAEGAKHSAAAAKSDAAQPAAAHTRRGRHGKAAVVEAEPRQTIGRGRRLRFNARLATVALGEGIAGSHDSLVRQNVKVNQDGLERIENDEQLHQTIVRKELIPVPVSDVLAINSSLPEDRRYCRPWTANFLSDLAKAHAEIFHGALLVSSAVRTVQFQQKLRHHNRNAAPAVGDITSPHLTGATIDIAKSPLNNQEREWMRGYLLGLQNQGKIDVEEEFREMCFHITVYKSYVDAGTFDFSPEDFPAASNAITTDQVASASR